MISNFIDDEYDVIVIGAGPAGSSTAASCAQQGLKTLLIEKRQEIGAPKRCAEGLSTHASEEFNMDIPKYCIAQTVDGAIVYAPNGKRFLIKLKEKTDGFILERKQFDKWLAAEASRAGAKVISKAEFIDFAEGGVKISFSGEEKIIKSKVVVAADGVESLVLRKAGLRSNKKPRFVDSGYQYEMSNVKLEDQHKIVLYFSFKQAPRGYIWIFPKGKDRANVGIGIAGDHKGKTAKEYLDEFIVQHPELSQGSILEVNAGNIPVGDIMKDMVIKNVVGIGDAVNQVNPIHGGGIAESIRAGRLLGNIIKEAVSKNDTKLLKKYNEVWWSQNGDKLKKVERVREIFEKLTDDDLNYLAENLTSDDLMAFAKGERIAKLAKLTFGLGVKRFKRKVGL